MNFFLSNNKLIVLIKCKEIREDISYKVKIYETTGYHSCLKNYLVNSVPFLTKIIFYKQTSKFGNTFNNGVEIDINMNYIKTLHFDEYDIKVDELFEKLPKYLIGRMSKKCMEAYLYSLKSSLVKSDIEVDKFVMAYNIPYDEHCKQKELFEIENAVKNLSAENINILEKIYAENSLNYSLSPNIFNYHKHQNIQQNALSIKQSMASSSDNTSPQKTFKYLLKCQVNLDGFLNLLPGHTYITENTTYKLIEMFLDYKLLVDLISKNLIVCFKKFENTQINIFKVHMYVRHDIYPEMSKLQVKQELLQYQILSSNISHLPEMKFFNSIQTMHWQSGFPNLLKTIVFSQETLVTNSKTFEIYGVFCDDLIKHLSNNYGPVIHIRRTINTGKMIFYYARIHIHLSYKHIIDNEIPKFGEEQCVSLDKCESFIEAHQARRKCCTLIYHTYFKWFNRSIKEINLLEFMNEYPENDFTKNIDPLFTGMPIMQVLLKNLIHYNYIHATNDINVYPESTEDQMTMAQIIIESLKSTRSLILPLVEFTMNEKKRVASSLTVKNSPFDGLYDGPLINATSIRTCEKMTDPENIGKQWYCNTLNTSMLLNKPDFRGIESKKNIVHF